MSNIEELRREIAEEKAKAAKKQEEKDLRKELFLLRNPKKVAAVRNIGSNLKHMGKNAVAMAKSAIKEKPRSKKKQIKKKKPYDPFENVNFNAFG